MTLFLKLFYGIYGSYQKKFSQPARTHAACQEFDDCIFKYVERGKGEEGRQKARRPIGCDEALSSLASSLSTQAPAGFQLSVLRQGTRGFMGILWPENYTFLRGLQ